MPSSPKIPKATLGLPTKYPSYGRRCHTQRRILFLFSLVLLVSSGSMIILHITAPPYSRSGFNSCQAPSTSSSSSSAKSAAAAAGCPASSRLSRWRSNQGQDRDQEKDQTGQENDFRSSFQNHGRPRMALPHPVDNHPEPIPAPPPALPSLPPTPLPVPLVPESSSQESEHPVNEPALQDQKETPDEAIESPSSVLMVNSDDQTTTTPISNDNNDMNNTGDSDGQQELEEIILQPFEDTLPQQEKYLTYLPYAGITNQFYGMLRGMHVAKALGRTLIIPPITASSHDKSKQNQPWSKFLDLQKFSKLTGTKVVEFHQLRDVERAEVNELKCGITCGFGSKRDIDFTAKGFLKQWKLNVTLNPLESDVTKLEAITSLLAPYHEDKFACISNTYKIVVKDKSEWQQFGQHLFFTEELESFVEEFLDQNLVKPQPVIDPSTGQENTPEHRYLVIHARRGDFAAYCETNFKGPKLIHCFPSTEQFAERIDKVQMRLNPNMDPDQILPVFVATNERRPEELKRFADLGWRYLDHQEMGTAEKLGVFGPMMVDQVLMARAQALVGIQMSTFSRVGALRQKDWFGREMEYM